MNYLFLTRTANSLTLSVRVSPNAKRAGFEGVWNNTHLKVALTAPPVDGKANAFLVDFLADYFRIRKSAISLVSGQTGRLKKVLISFPSADDVQKALEQLDRLR